VVNQRNKCTGEDSRLNQALALKFRILPIASTAQRLSVVDGLGALADGLLTPPLSTLQSPGSATFVLFLF